MRRGEGSKRLRFLTIRLMIETILRRIKLGEKRAKNILKAAEGDHPRMMEIYAVARRFMAAHGNPNQWGPTNWPPEERIRADIAEGSSYVCVRQNRVVGAFYFRQGEGIEPTYQRIENGAWKEAGPYGVIHRLAGDGSAKGIGTLCLTWAYQQCGHLRIDTHPDNHVMQNLLRKNGFVHCGTVYVVEDTYPRLAFEKVSSQ